MALRRACVSAALPCVCHLPHERAQSRVHATIAYTSGACMQSLEEKEPFSQYAVVAKNNPPPRGLQVAWGNPADPATYPSGTFDIIIDNNGKSMEECQPLIDTYAKDVRA